MTKSTTDIPILDDDQVERIQSLPVTMNGNIVATPGVVLSREDRDALSSTVRALRAENERLKSPRLFPIQDGNPVRWELAEKAYATYRQLFGSSQSLGRLAERGGFGVEEFACLYLGHSPMCKHGKQCAAEVESQIGYVAQLQSQLERVTKERQICTRCKEEIKA